MPFSTPETWPISWLRSFVRSLDSRGPAWSPSFSASTNTTVVNMNPIRSAVIPSIWQTSSQTITRYPCYLKPPWLNLGILGFKLDSDNDLQRALAVARREYPAWSPLYLPFFERYIDCEKFPLAAREIMLVEDFVDGPQVTVEGWVANARPALWAITDTNTYPGTRIIDNFSLPSRHPVHIQELLSQQGPWKRSAISAWTTASSISSSGAMTMRSP